MGTQEARFASGFTASVPLRLAHPELQRRAITDTGVDTCKYIHVI